MSIMSNQGGLRVLKAKILQIPVIELFHENSFLRGNNTVIVTLRINNLVNKIKIVECQNN